MMKAEATPAGNVRVTLSLDFHPAEATQLVADLRRYPDELHLSQLASQGTALASLIEVALKELRR